MESDILERAIAAVVAVETGHRAGKRMGKVEPIACLEARIEFGRTAPTPRRFVVTVPRRGTAADDRADPPDEATREIASASGRLVVTMPRALLEPLFASGLPGLSAETELADAFAAFAVAICEHVLVAAHGVDGFELATPIVEPCVLVASSAVAVGVLDHWIAAELAEASLTLPTRVRPLPRLVVAR